MKKLLSTILAAALLLTACSSAAPVEAARTESTEAAAVSTDAVQALTPVQAYTAAADEHYAYTIAETLSYNPEFLSSEQGFRNAGSEAEHKAADYIAAEMEALGLTVEKVPVTVDLWSMNGASLTIAGTDIALNPVSYATNGTDADGITAELVDVGAGTMFDYEGLDVEGKIVLAGIDQWNVAWIDQYMNEAAVHGAAAIVTYDVGGYATYNDEQVNMQDLCSSDVMPCVSISAADYAVLAEALEAGSSMATLIVDNVIVPEGGISYNVVGKLAGRSSEQQMIISGHYDIYFNGFQDDSCAIGLVLGIAKGMVDSGYQPENDILFIAHGSEEWGAIDSQFDWTTGAWEMINHAHPEWAGKTIAMLNFELPAFYDGLPQMRISCVPEFAPLTRSLVENGLLGEVVNGIYPEGIDPITVDSNTMEDGVSYRASGVPYFINIPGTQGGPEGWIQQHYHTVSDDRSTYSADVMQTNLNVYGTLAIYLDSTPALELSMTATCDDLEEALDPDYAAAAGIDVDAYSAALAALRSASEAHDAKIADVNARYAAAIASGASQEELDAIRAEGTALNKTTLAVFKAVQDAFIGIQSTSTIVIKHIGYQENLMLLDGIKAALEKGELGNEEETGALDLAWMLNGATEFGYYNFSAEVNDISRSILLEETNEGNMFWGTGKGFILADTWQATVGMLAKAEEEEPDFTEELAILNAAYKAQAQLYRQTAEAEITAMLDVAGMF